MKQIQKTHIATLIKYLGVSFITGSLSHGFFTGERQLITAIIGLSFFTLGTLLLRDKQADTGSTIFYSVIFAIAVGAFTGGLQHFPDSPERSMLIVPLGFMFSVYSFYALETQQFWKKQEILYTLIGTIVMIGISLMYYFVVEKGYLGENSHTQDNSLPHDETVEDTHISGNNTGSVILQENVKEDDHQQH